MKAKAFSIYKEGTTDNWVNILMVNPITGESENWSADKIKAKIRFYKSMGYKIKIDKDENISGL
jgi:hypothetical protein